MAETLVLAPALMLAVVLTITEVMGRPPSNPDKKLPTPCAFNSTFALEYLFIGSILSAASKQRSVSMLATVAIVAAVTHTAGLPIAERSGKLNCPKNSLAEEAVGSLTRCSPAITKEGLVSLNTSLISMPTITTTSAPGSSFIFFRNVTLLNATKIANETTVTMMAPV